MCPLWRRPNACSRCSRRSRTGPRRPGRSWPRGSASTSAPAPRRRRAARPRHPGRGASAATAAATGCAPATAMPPLMFTAAEAATVALGLIAARRDGLDADGALAKVRRVLPDRVRLRVEALEHTLRFTGDAVGRAARRRDAARARRGRAPRPPRDARYTDSEGVETRARAQPVRRRRPLRPLVRPGATTTRRGEPRALRADRFGTVRLGGRGEPPPRGLRRRRVRHAARSRACRGRTRSRSCCTPTSRPPQAVPAHARRARAATPDGHPPAHARRLARLGRRPARRAPAATSPSSPAGAARRRPRAGRERLADDLDRDRRAQRGADARAGESTSTTFRRARRRGSTQPPAEARGSLRPRGRR